MPYQGYSDSILLPKNLFAGLNLNFLIKNSWFPIEKDEKKVVILIDDPLDLDKIRNIELTFPKKDIEYKVSLKSEIHKFLETTPEEEEVRECLIYISTRVSEKNPSRSASEKTVFAGFTRKSPIYTSKP